VQIGSYARLIGRLRWRSSQGAHVMPVHPSVRL